jgi:hypothetical protein
MLDERYGVTRADMLRRFPPPPGRVNVSLDEELAEMAGGRRPALNELPELPMQLRGSSAEEMRLMRTALREAQARGMNPEHLFNELRELRFGRGGELVPGMSPGARMSQRLLRQSQTRMAAARYLMNSGGASALKYIGQADQDPRRRYRRRGIYK